MMMTLDLYFARLLKTRIEEVIADQNRQLRNAQDWADHKKRCGYIQALDDVLGMIEDVQKKVDKD